MSYLIKNKLLIVRNLCAQITAEIKSVLWIDNNLFLHENH